LLRDLWQWFGGRVSVDSVEENKKFLSIEERIIWQGGGRGERGCCMKRNSYISHIIPPMLYSHTN